MNCITWDTKRAESAWYGLTFDMRDAQMAQTFMHPLMEGLKLFLVYETNHVYFIV